MYNLLLPYNQRDPLTIDNIMDTMDNMMICLQIRYRDVREANPF